MNTLSEAIKRQHKINPNYAMRGKHHSEETKQKMRRAALLRHDLNVELGRRTGGWNRGLKQSPEIIARRVEGIRRHITSCEGKCGSPACGAIRSPSALAWAAYSAFLQEFEVVVPEARFGPYAVDFLLAEEWLAIEVDGEYWHKQKADKDSKRDQYLLTRFSLPVVRISERDIKDAMMHFFKPRGVVRGTKR